MRSFFYWLTTTVIAVIAASASEQQNEATQVLSSLPGQLDILPVPEPSRAILLGVGIMAIAFTYREAWMNLKRSK
jgi:hypothetical protein